MLESTEKRKPRSSKIYMQWLAVFSAFLVKLQIGIFVAWPSPNISRLSGKDSPIPITSDEASWLVSTLAIGGVLGIIISGATYEWLGRKKLLVLTIVMFSISNVCIICATSIEFLYAARSFAGIANTLCQCTLSVYVGEVATPSIRGTLISLSVFGNSVGTLVGTIAESYIDMKITSSMYLAMNVANLILISWLKNTPYYFAKKFDYKRAKESIAFYHGHDEEKIFNDVKKFTDAQSTYTLKDKLRDLRLPVVRKSMILLAIVSVLPTISGHIILLSYMETILKSARSTIVNPKEFVIYANIMNVVSCFATVRLMDILGRRILLIISSIGTTVAMAALGTHFYLLRVNYDSENLQWLPLSAITLYQLSVYVGFLSVYPTVFSELFPEQLRSIAALVLNSSVCIVFFAITKSYQPIVDFAGEMYAFWMYAIFASLAIPCALFLMPETKGKSFQEIQEMLK